MQGYSSSQPVLTAGSSATGLNSSANTEAASLLRQLDLEMAQQRARRQFQKSDRRTVHAIGVMLLLILLCAAFYALWRLESLHDSRPWPRKQATSTSAAP